MDLTQLEQDLENALSEVITEEAQLQAAIDAVKAALPQAVEDSSLAGVKEALLADGWSAPADSTTTETTTTTVPPVA